MNKLSDTNSKITDIQFELIKKASPQKRFYLTCSLTQTVRELSRRAIKKANPGLNKRELDLLFVKYHYGIDLYYKLKKYLEEREKSSIL